MTTESRLALVAPDLELAIGPSIARAIALLAVQSALAAHPASDTVVRESLAAIQAGEWSRTTTHREHVERVAVRLDEEYWALYDDAGDALTPEVVQAFSAARAVASLAAALGPDSTSAAKEALYEAHAAMEQPDQVRLLGEARRLAGVAKSPGTA